MSIKPKQGRTRQDRAARLLKKAIATPGSVSRSRIMGAAMTISPGVPGGLRKSKPSKAETAAASALKKRLSGRVKK